MRTGWQQLLDSTRVREFFGKSQGTLDHRTPYQQDFDRVVFSSPVRRLQDKAQVFPLEPNDAVRNRLTHSLEVSTVSRGIVIRIAALLGSDHEFSRRKQDISDVAATAGLVHDLGNPPFGHFGEDAIREWFGGRTGKEALRRLGNNKQMIADIALHEGNARTIRLLCSLQVLADRFGLNLTAGTLAASMKYVAASHRVSEQDHTRSKPGFCWWEQPVVEWAQKQTGIGDSRHPIAFIVEAADDAVYSLCDLEDAVRKGILSWAELCNALAAELSGDAKRKSLCAWLDSCSNKIDAWLKANDLEPGMRARDEARVIWFRTKGHGMIIDGAARSFTKRYSSIMNGDFKGELANDQRFSPEAASLIECCTKTARKLVYPVRPNLELELKGRRVIHDLMDLLWIGISKYNGESLKSKDTAGKAWKLLSENYKALFESEWRRSAETARERRVNVNVLRQYLRLLLLTDYVGGMTDTFACTLHKSLSNG